MTGVVSLGTVRYTLVKNGGKVRVLTGGATGPQGETGATGATGPAGADGVSPTIAPLVIASPNVVEQRNGTSAQTFRSYNRYTSASDYELGAFKWSGNVLLISTEKAGTGVARSIQIAPGGTGLWSFDTGGNLYAIADNTYDVGATSSLRPRNVHVGTSVLVPRVDTNGVKFPAAQSASSDVNTLDDYEEGTYSPTLGFGSVGGTTGSVYSLQSGSYTKKGREVSFRAEITLSAVGTDAGGAFVSLPFTPATGIAFAVNVRLTGMPAGGLAGPPYAVIQASSGGVAMEIFHAASGNGIALSKAQFQVGSSVIVSGTYHV